MEYTSHISFLENFEKLPKTLKYSPKVYKEGSRKRSKSKEIKPKEIKPRNAYGVVIGIGKYNDLGIPPLKYAKEDAQAIYDILTNPTYGNFPKENVKLLLDEKATLAEIKSAMGTYLARNAGEDDMVCIYFAGHGSPEIDLTGKADDKLEKFIVPYDAKKDDLFGYGLSMDVIEEIFHRITSKRVVFFLDCCYSGEAGGRTFSRPSVRNITISEKFLEQLSGEGRIIITASKPDELSLEIDELKHGIFTYYVAEGLKGKADLNGDGYVTVDELYDYVSEQVEAKARQLGGKQHPVYKGEKVGEIPLTRCETKTMRRIKKLNATAAKLFGQEEWREAIKNWEEVLKIDGKNAEALDGIKDAKKCILIDLHEKGMPSKLFDDAMTILKKDPSTYTEIEKKLSNYIVEMLKGNLCIENYIDIRNTIKGLEKPPIPKPKVEEERIKKEEEKKKQIFELTSQAQKLFGEKRYAEAIVKWHEVLEVDPENRKALESIKEVEEILAAIEEKKRKIAELNKSAQQLYEEEKYSEAIDEWKKVLDLDPENQTAREEFKKAGEKVKEKILELSSQAQKLYEEKRYAEAIAKWQKVLKLDPEDHKATEGIKEIERILEEVEKKKRRVDELNTSAQRLYDEGKYHEAIGKWKEVLNFDPKNQAAKEGIKKAGDKEAEEKLPVKKYCPICGLQNERGLKYCTRCGAKL